MDEASAARILRNLTTVPGRKILEALRDYGGYIVDDIGSATEGAALCAEHAVNAEGKYSFVPAHLRPRTATLTSFLNCFQRRFQLIFFNQYSQ